MGAGAGATLGVYAGASVVGVSVVDGDVVCAYANDANASGIDTAVLINSRFIKISF